MRTYFILLTLLLLGHFTAEAQFKLIYKSASFEEPQTGFAKILMMKNRNTAYIHIENNDKINYKLYDPGHKNIVTKTVEHQFGKLKGLDVEGLFEINGDITILLSSYEKKIPTLIRIVMDGKTGAIKSQTEMATLNKLNLGSGFAMAYGGVEPPRFIVRKDPYSENYAFASFNSFSSESDKRVEVQHFNKDHKLISKSNLSTPDDKYKYVNIVDLAVMGDKEVFAAIFAYNTKSSGGRSSELYVASFKNNQENITYTTVKTQNDVDQTDGILKYNPVTNTIYLMAQIQLKSKARFNTTTTYYGLEQYKINPETKQVSDGTEISLEAISAKLRQTYGPKSSYFGVLQNFYINEDGGSTVLLEGLETVVTQRGSSSSVQYFLGSIASITYDKSGNVKSSGLVIKRQSLNNSIMMGGGMVDVGPLYHYKRDFTAQKLRGGNQFKSFAYLNGKSKDYVLINDIEENEEKVRNNKLTTIQGLGECNAFSFDISSKEVIPVRKFVFGRPADKKDNNLALFTISDYDRKENVYATLKLEKGKGGGVSIVWMTPE